MSQRIGNGAGLTLMSGLSRRLSVPVADPDESVSSSIARMASMCLLCGNVSLERRGVGREIGDLGCGRLTCRAAAHDPIEQDARSDLYAGGSRSVRRSAPVLSTLLADPLPVMLETRLEAE